MEHAARVKIVLTGGEFEIEGSEEFVNSYADTIASLSELLKNTPTQSVAEGKESNLNPGKQFAIFDPEASAPPAPDAAPLASPDSFGELYYKAPKSTSKSDKVLLASFFVQSHNGEGTFTTREVNKLLRDHGIDMTNTAHFNKLNQDYKKVFKVRQGHYKVSEEGVEHLRGILQ
ncbi:MAG: hypothetical protein WA958_02605 [Tunicatimonas sp.]